MSLFTIGILNSYHVKFISKANKKILLNLIFSFIFCVYFSRKAVRATIVLLPLFGLDWLLTVYRQSNSDGGGCIWPILHRYLIVILGGARGLMVSIVFCYRNGEVVLDIQWNH